jgi:hypothetical protein
MLTGFVGYAEATEQGSKKTLSKGELLAREGLVFGESLSFSCSPGVFKPCF